MKRLAAVTMSAFMFACLPLAGCDDSSAPLSDANQASLDKALPGLWMHQHQEGVTYYHVGRLGSDFPEGLMRVVILSHARGDILQQPEVALAFRTVVAGHAYLNIGNVTHEQLETIMHQGWEAARVESYMIVKYRVDTNKLVVWYMDNQAKRKAIEAGKVQGEMKANNRYRFTDTTENLARLVAAERRHLFAEEPLRFERVR